MSPSKELQHKQDEYFGGIIEHDKHDGGDPEPDNPDPDPPVSPPIIILQPSTSSQGIVRPVTSFPPESRSESGSSKSEDPPAVINAPSRRYSRRIKSQLSSSSSRMNLADISKPRSVMNRILSKFSRSKERPAKKEMKVPAKFYGKENSDRRRDAGIGTGAGGSGAGSGYGDSSGAGGADGAGLDVLGTEGLSSQSMRSG